MKKSTGDEIQHYHCNAQKKIYTLNQHLVMQKLQISSQLIKTETQFMRVKFSTILQKKLPKNKEKLCILLDLVIRIALK